MKTARLLILFIGFILFSSLAYSDFTTSMEFNYTMDNAYTNATHILDTNGNNDATRNNVRTNKTGIINEAHAYRGNAYSITKNSISSYDSMSFWVNGSLLSTTALETIIGESNDKNKDLHIGNVGGVYFGEVITIKDSNGATYITTNFTDTGWKMITVVWGGSHYNIYINGTNQTVSHYTGGSHKWTNEIGLIGARYNSGYQLFLNRRLDQSYLWDGYSLTQNDIYTLFNESINITAPAGTDPYHRVKIINRYNSSNLAGVNVTLNNTDWNITQSDGIAYFSNLTGNYTFNATKTNYFTIYGLAEENQTVNYNMSQSIINFSCYEKITNNSLSCINGTIYPNAGTYNFTIGVTGYYNVTQQETITALDNKTLAFTGFANSYLNVSAHDVRNNVSISNFTLIYTDLATNWTETLVADGTNLNNTLIAGRNYTVQIQAIGFEFKNHTFNNFSSQDYQFQLYTANSVLINIFEEDGGARIYDNITVRFEDNASVITEYWTNTSILYVDNLSIMNYTISFISTNYSTRSYTITVGNNTFQTLNAYLVDDGASSTIFEFKNKNTGASLEGVTLTIQKLINLTWTVVEVLTSDITGRTSFDYVDDETYKFIATLSGYTTKSFTLDPILFNSYTINLEPTITETDWTDYAGINIYFSPNVYYNNLNNTVTFTFISPYGEFVSYGFNATYKTTTISKSGANAYGSVISDDLEITGASFGDVVVVKYNYVLTNGNTKTYTRVFTVDNSDATTGTILKGLRTDYGLGILEKMLIAITITILVAGAGAYFGGGISAGVLSLLILGIFAYTGFIPLWSVITSMISIFIILAWRSTL